MGGALGLVAGCSPAADAPQPATTAATSPASEVEAAKLPQPAPPVSTEAKDAPPTGETTISLVVGPTIQDKLVPVSASSYARDEMGPLLDSLREASGPYCRYKHGLEKLDREAVEKFVTPASWFLQSELGVKWTIVAGCWNFIWMNDRRPHRDFEVAKSLAPSTHGYRCYGVGVMQPYIMSDVLGCSEVTMIDFDWQIHGVHEQLLAAWRDGGLADDQLDATLASLRVDWIAHHEPQEKHEVSLASICHRGIASRCRATFAAFDGRRVDPSLRSVTLQLAGLHEIEFGEPSEERGTPVVFLSNATEKHFLRGEEFRELLDRMESTLLPGQRGLFVHHVGNDSTFGIYQMLRTESGSKISVLCRDEYRRGKGKSEVYETWFEEKLNRPGRRMPVPPTCKSIRIEGVAPE
jgi:hypothetical protein